MLQVIYVHMTSSGNSFNKVTNYVNKLEGVRRDSQDKALERRAKTLSKFKGYYSWIQGGRHL